MVLIALGACGSRENNSLGVTLIDEEAAEKAVQLLTLAPPDTSSVLQRTTAATGGGVAITALVGSRPGFHSRALMRFESSALFARGTDVDSAAIELPYRNGFGDTPPLSMELYLVTEEWTENDPDSLRFPTLAATPLATVDVPFPAEAIDTLRVRLDSAVQGWVADSTTNFGIALVPAAGQDTEIEFNTRESVDPPRLFVYRTVDSEVSATVLETQTDTFFLETTGAFTPVTDVAGRWGIQRGIASRVLMHFAFPQFDDRATINRAEVTLHVDPTISMTDGFAVGIQRVTGAWGVDSTEVDPLLFGVTTVTTDMDSISISITGLLDLQVEDGNGGLQLRALEERADTELVFFHGADTADPALAPSLRIWYTPGSSAEGSE